MNLAYGTVELRAIEEADMEFCRDMINAPGIEASTVGKSFPVSTTQQLAWFRDHNGENALRLLVHEKKTGPIGMVSLTDISWINRTAEVGVKFVNSRERQMQNTEDTAHCLMNYAFGELNLHCLYAQVLNDNLLSRKLLIHLGFQEDGTLRSRIYKHGCYHDLVQYSILKDEYYTRCGK